MEGRNGESIKPVVSRTAERWLLGEVSAREYFADARREAAARARAHVATRVRRAQALARAG